MMVTLSTAPLSPSSSHFFTLLYPVFPELQSRPAADLPSSDTMSDNEEQVAPFNLCPKGAEERPPIFRNLYDSFDVRSGLSFCEEFIYFWINKARRLQLSLRSNPRIIIWVDWKRSQVYGSPLGSTFTTEVSYMVNGTAVNTQEKFYLLRGSLFYLNHIFNKLNITTDKHLRIHGARLHFDSFSFTNGHKVRYMVLTPLPDESRLNMEFQEYGLEEVLPRPLLLRSQPHHFSVGCLTTPQFAEQAPRSIPTNDGLLAWPARAGFTSTSSPPGGQTRGPPNVSMVPPAMLNPILSQALSRPPSNLHYWPQSYSLFSMPPPGPFHPPGPLPQPYCSIRILTPQVPAPGGPKSHPVPRKLKKIAPKPVSSSSDVDIISIFPSTVEGANAPSSTESLPGTSGGERYSLPPIVGLPAPDSSPTMIPETTSLIEDDQEPPIGDQFINLNKKRRRNNID